MNSSDHSKAAQPDQESGADTSAPSVDAAVQGKLGLLLRQSYNQIVEEKIPSRFHDLLIELKNKEAPSRLED